MTSRRNFGTVRKLPSGRWQARYSIGPGKLGPAPRTFATKNEATRWLASVETDQARGGWIDPRAGRITLEEYAWAWLHGKVRLAPRTREIYECQLRLHVLPSIDDDVPALGPTALGDLTPELVRSWYGALLEVGGSSVAAKAYTRLRQIMKQAVDDERIAKNPCRIDGGGVERHPEQRFAALPELLRLVDAVPDRYRAMIVTAGLAGLRQGELFALRRADVDLVNATIHVRRKRVRLSSGKVVEGEPKSHAGRRTVALPTPVVAALVRQLTDYTGDDPDDYVFITSAGHPLDRHNFRPRVWVPAVEAAGLDGLRMHDLRHTAGTLAAQTGATTKELMARLGHASPRAAMVYQHATEERDRLIADRLTSMTAAAELESAGEAVARDGTPADSGTDVARNGLPEEPL